MVINDLNTLRMALSPEKANSPLVVDANAVLAPAVGLQCLQLVARWDAQAGKLGGRVDLKQLAPGDALDVAEAGNRAAVKQGLGVCARERADHAPF